MGIDTEFNQCQIAGAGQKSMLLCTRVFVVAFTELNVTCRYLRMIGQAAQSTSTKHRQVPLLGNEIWINVHEVD